MRYKINTIFGQSIFVIANTVELGFMFATFYQDKVRVYTIARLKIKNIEVNV